jgi:hypothetical protein
MKIRTNLGSEFEAALLDQRANLTVHQGDLLKMSRHIVAHGQNPHTQNATARPHNIFFSQFYLAAFILPEESGGTLNASWCNLPRRILPIGTSALAMFRCPFSPASMPCTRTRGVFGCILALRCRHRHRTAKGNGSKGREPHSCLGIHA